MNASLITCEAEYFGSHGEAIGFPIPVDARRQTYEFNIRSAQAALQSSPFLTRLISYLRNAAENYAGGRPELLFFPYNPSDLEIKSKPFDGLLTKIYRVNFIYNRRYPEPPKAEFISQANMYEHEKVNDLLRSRLVCKYMDGPKYLAEALGGFCQEEGCEYKSYPMNNDVGYYAWHCYMRVPIDIMEGDHVSTKKVWFELQFTTQLAEVITSLTHGLYEGDRTSQQASDGQNWKWEPGSQRFRSAYLGHSLHLLEGIIQSFRNEVLQIGDGHSADHSDAIGSNSEISE